MLEAKRQSIYSSIRKSHIKSKMLNTRLQLSQQQTESALKQLISLTSEQINPLQLKMLLSWASLGQENAIIHIGNLIIDQIISIKQLKANQQIYGKILLVKSCCCGWLLCVMYENAQFGEKELLGLVECFISWAEKYETAGEEQEKILSAHILVIIRQIVKNHSSALQYLLSQQDNNLNARFIGSLIKMTHKGNNKQQKVLYSLLASILSKDQEICCKFMEVAQLDKVLEAIQAGTKHIQPHIRALCVQMTSNILKNYSHPFLQHQQTNLTKIQILASKLCSGFLTKSWSKEKTKVQTEITFFLAEFVQFCTFQTLFAHIHEDGLIKELKDMLTTFEGINRDAELNCLQILAFLKRQHFDHPNISISLLLPDNIMDRMFNEGFL